MQALGGLDLKISARFCTLLLFVWLIPALCLASPGMMLPKVDDGGRDISGWLMSEKLDGVRGYWDGQRLWSKNGKPLSPPQAFVVGLPDFPLEGELWGGRGTFEKTASIVLQQQPHRGWLALKFAIFDVPKEAGHFTSRIQKARDWFAAHPSVHAFVISQRPVRDRAQLQDELRRIEGLGGEGLIVRKPDALYAAGRSAEILKVKDFQDAEAVVVGHIPGKGRNLGVLGSLLVEMADGTRFKIGSGFSDVQRGSPPALGEVVTFKYYGWYKSGIPRFPSFLRIRSDRGL